MTALVGFNTTVVSVTLILGDFGNDYLFLGFLQVALHRESSATPNRNFTYIDNDDIVLISIK